MVGANGAHQLPIAEAMLTYKQKRYVLFFLRISPSFNDKIKLQSSCYQRCMEAFVLGVTVKKSESMFALTNASNAELSVFLNGVSNVYLKRNPQ